MKDKLKVEFCKICNEDTVKVKTRKNGWVCKKCSSVRLDMGGVE